MLNTMQTRVMTPSVELTKLCLTRWLPGRVSELPTGYTVLQLFKKKAQEFSRGMKPTEAETATTVRAVGCDTESEVRIHTLPWR